MNEKTKSTKSTIPDQINPLHSRDHSLLPIFPAFSMLQHLSKDVSEPEYAPVSIAELASKFTLKPEFVLKSLQTLEQYGLEFTVLDKEHCQLRRTVDLLDAEQIETVLGKSSILEIPHIDILPIADSTNQILLSSAETDPRPRVCLAEYQTAGRGRHGRRWVAPYAAGLCMSLRWCLPTSIERRQLISLLPGVALMRVLKKAGLDQHAGLKWPNDLLSHGKKLAGVLIETLPQQVGIQPVILGIGINVYNTQRENLNSLMSDIQQPWLALSELINDGQTLSRNQLAASVITELVQMLLKVEDEGFAAVLQEWRTYDITQDKPVKLIWPDHNAQSEATGIARGISDEGMLQLEIEGEIKQFASGELSLRLLRGL